ncbi:MAG: tryptophan-rich sensory protein [Bacteroidia bacterium]|jgi:tryptophan-rich sensory protein|nr:tryptophan-rich sensory protein [Bacteroidia bacterium]
MKLSLTAKILICSIACLLLGSLSGIGTGEAVDGWYSQINKPSWNPPNWLFGPVWTVLYLLMGVAFALVWNGQGKNKRMALTLFVLQFVLNLLWSFLFFGLARMDWALIEILLLLVFITLTISAFSKINRTAAILMIPYLLWVGFASLLNSSLYFLNA